MSNVIEIAGRQVKLENGIENLLNGLVTGARVLGYIVNENSERSYMADQIRMMYEFIDRGAREIRMRLIIVYDKKVESIVDAKIHAVTEYGSMGLLSIPGGIEDRLMYALGNL